LPARSLLAGLLFFLSGAAAVVYQVVWQRILALQSGVGIYSIAIIVAAFMAGLGIGSLAGGMWCERRSARRALIAFSLIELGIAVWGALSGPLLYDVLSLRFSSWFDPLPQAALVQFLFLAPPTFLMGMSLPFLVRALVRDTATAARTIGYLYGLNMLGAACGALATPWLLVRHFGMRNALLAAAALNLLAAVGALALWRGTADLPPAETKTPPATSEKRPFALWLTLYSLSGFVALALEILWFRLIDVGIKSTAFTFGTVLAVYLAGGGIGTLVGTRLASRLYRPLRIFLLCQAGILLYAGLSVLLLVSIPPDTPLFSWFFDLWGGRRSYNLGGAWNWDPVLRLYLLLPVALYGPPTVLMGFSFVALQQAVHHDVAGIGRRVGLLQAANIVGCVAGTLVVGLVSFTVLGSAGTLRVLVAGGAVLALAAALGGEGRKTFGTLTAVLLCVTWLLPGEDKLWRRLHGMTEADTAVFAEDATGVIAVSHHGNIRRVWVNGRHHSILPFGGIHTLLGAGPAIIHPAPERAAVIGLGSGDTAWGAACRRPETTSVTVFEICAPQMDLLRRVAAEPDPPAKLARFLADPRVNVRYADGRNALLRSPDRYDIIEIDALPPSSPYAGNLYSVEFYQLSARRLRPGGLMSVWAPSPRVRASFLAAFPHVLEFDGGTVLIGSSRPIPIDQGVWQARATTPQMIAYLGMSRVYQVLEFLRSARPAEHRPIAPEDLNHDLFPRDEFNTR